MYPGAEARVAEYSGSVGGESKHGGDGTPRTRRGGLEVAGGSARGHYMFRPTGRLYKGSQAKGDVTAEAHATGQEM